MSRTGNLVNGSVLDFGVQFLGLSPNERRFVLAVQDQRWDGDSRVIDVRLWEASLSPPRSSAVDHLFGDYQ